MTAHTGTAERTPWFSWRDRPSRKGWYEFRGWLVDGITRMYWNGTQWGAWVGTGRNNWVQLAECPADQWRGLVRRAK